MKSIILKELRLQRKLVLIWSFILILTAAFGGIEFKGLQNQMDMLETTVADFPRIVKILFGVDAFPISTPLGGYASMFYWYQLVLFALAVYIGFYIVSRDEKENYADFIYTKPYDRRTILLSKGIVVLIINAVLALLTAVGTVVFLVPFLGDGQSIMPHIITSTIGVFLTQVIFSAVGMLFGSITGHYKRGMLGGFLVLIVAYVIAFSIEYVGNLNHLNFLSPVRYFNLAALAEGGLSPLYLALSAALIGTLMLLAIRGLGKRDLI
ncbi:ABC transporter permease [Gudongella sp. DL1XJH-153]|uniref:ABC transporter permease n=1 Tax=Gudongella sp. DL1XJH-153 TaxID=3409804 RepID=UPI003BB65867